MPRKEYLNYAGLQILPIRALPPYTHRLLVIAQHTTAYGPHGRVDRLPEKRGQSHQASTMPIRLDPVNKNMSYTSYRFWLRLRQNTLEKHQSPCVITNVESSPDQPWDSRHQQASKGPQGPPTSLCHYEITEISHSDAILKETERGSTLSNRDKNLPKEMVFFIELNKIHLLGLKLPLFGQVGWRWWREGALWWGQINYRGKEHTLLFLHI